MEEVSAQWIDVHGKAWDQLDQEGREYTLGLGNKTVSLSADTRKELAPSSPGPVHEGRSRNHLS
jgi:hypothetical protein